MPARSSPSRTIAIFSTTWPAGFWNSIAAAAFRGKGTTRSWLEQKQDRLASEEKAASARQKTLERELEWIRLAPQARQAKSKARINAYEQMSAEKFEEREDEFEIQIPPGKHLGDLVVEAERRQRRPMATSC